MLSEDTQNTKRIEILKKDFELADSRGKLVQLVHSGFEQINVLVSNMGVLRGGHYHKEATEAFYVIEGVVDVIVQEDGKDVIQRFREGDFFALKPFVCHSMRFPEYCVMVQMYSKCIELSNGKKDIYLENT